MLRVSTMTRHCMSQPANRLAVSRARSLKGLKVMALPQRNLGGANPQVKEFFEKFLSKK